MDVKYTLVLGTGWGDAATTQAVEAGAALDSWGGSDLQDRLRSADGTSRGHRARGLQLAGMARDISLDRSAPLL